MATGGSMAKPENKEFIDQIKQLEIEGAKLMSATSELGESLLGATSPVTGSARITGVSTSPNSLSALTDITAEQHTISQLRSQLDAQSRETERLQRAYLGRSGATSDITPLPYSERDGAGSTCRAGGEVLHGAFTSNRELHTLATSSGAFSSSSGGTYRRNLPFHHRSLSALDIPTAASATSSEYGGLGAATGLSKYTTQPSDIKSFDGLSESLAEKQLQISREENETLRVRMREAIRISEEQKQQFQSNIEQLKQQLAESVSKRDVILSQKGSEVLEMESSLQRVRVANEHLEQANRMQEQTLLEMTTKMETLQKDQYSLQALQNQVRSLLIDQEQRRGQSFYEGEPIQRQSVSMLCHTLEKCVQKLEAETETKQLKNNDLLQELDAVRSTFQEKIHNVNKEHQDKLSAVTEAHELELAAAVERSVVVRKQVTALQEQIANIQQQSSDTVRETENSRSELQGRLQIQTAQYAQDLEAWNKKVSALELALDHSQKEAASMKSERDETVRKMTVCESRFDELQHTITRLESDLDTEKSRVEKSKAQEEELEKHVETLAAQLTDRCSAVEQLQSTVDNMKLEHDQQLQKTLEDITRESKESTRGQVNALAAQLTMVREKCNSVTTQHEVLKSQYKALEEKHEAASESLKEARTKLDISLSNNEHASSLLEERNNDIERLTSERDNYFKLISDNNREFDIVKAQNEKLTVQLEERERGLTALQDQHTQIASLAEQQSDSTKAVKHERDQLQQQLNEKIIETEEIRLARDSLSKKLKLREKHAAALEEDNKILAVGLNDVKTDLEQVIKEKETLFTELKDSRYEVSALKEELETERRENENKQLEAHRDIRKLAHKLKAVESDLKLAQRTVHAHEQVDGKAVRVAGRMQKEVTLKRGQIDALSSKLMWLEETLQNVTEERKILGEENETLSETVQAMTSQNQRLTSEMQSYVTTNADLKGRVTRLEAALEKAAVKYAAAQAQLEQHEQEVARLKLNHQLELKELERNLRNQNARPSIQQQQFAMGALSSNIPASVGGAASQNGNQQLLSQYVQRNVHLQRSGELDLPVSQKSQQGGADLPSNQNAVGGELRELLDEMKSLVISAKQQQQSDPRQQQQQQQQPQLPQNSNVHVPIPTAPATDSRLSGGSGPTLPAAMSARSRSRSRGGGRGVADAGNQRQSFAAVLVDTEGPSDIEADQLNLGQRQVQGHNSRSSREYRSARDVASSRVTKATKRHQPVVSSPVRHRSPPVFHINQKNIQGAVSSSRGRQAKGRHGNTGDRSTSPVSDLLSMSDYLPDVPDVSDVAQKYSDSTDSASSIDASHSHIDTPARPSRKGALKQMYSSDAQSLCQRLEQRIENLNKLGNHLQTENIEMAALMEDQEEKLKRVKHEKVLNKK